MMRNAQRELPIGAEVRGDGAVDFRVWCTTAQHVEVVLDSGLRATMTAEGDGYFRAVLRDAAAGTRYRFALDGGEPRPDPAARFQPEGPHGPSQVVDPGTYHWGDDDWRGPDMARPVFYELHVGTFTPQGTWRAATAALDALATLGISVIELMPVAAFPGRFGWGYDGVDLFAPSQLYGTPDDFRAFVDRAHALGMGVILDVVYNHTGPDGCYLREFSPDYFSEVHHTEWGDALNFDGRNAGPVREFVLANVRYWIVEYHLDGFRLDATQSIFDDGEPHILSEITATARAAAADRRSIVIAENEPQDTRLVRPPAGGGHGMDAVWNDDFHHSARVALTGRSEAYYSDYRGTPQELLSAVRWGYLYQGQHYRWQNQARGTSALDLQPTCFINFLQNHDQVANSAHGRRLHQLTSPGRHRAMTALLLLAPGTPMLLQGEEYDATTPFMFFADHEPELARRVHEGRREFLAQFPSIAPRFVQEQIADPADPETFRSCVLDPAERARNTGATALHQDLIALSRTAGFGRRDRDHVHGAVIAPDALLLRYLGSEAADDRLLLVNLGSALELSPLPEPLLAPPGGQRWRMLWSSEAMEYGGGGIAELLCAPTWRIPAEAAVVLAPELAGPSATTAQKKSEAP
jgi:maltooligosyltrehalose trehalohydrolase